MKQPAAPQPRAAKAPKARAPAPAPPVATEAALAGQEAIRDILRAEAREAAADAGGAIHGYPKSDVKRIMEAAEDIKSSTARSVPAGKSASGAEASTVDDNVTAATSREVHDLWDAINPTLGRHLKVPENASDEIAALIMKGSTTPTQILDDLVAYYRVILQDHPGQLAAVEASIARLRARIKL